MRSRTEMVTTTLDGSDFDEDSDFEDSEEDWKPETVDPKGMKRKSRDIITGGGRRGGAGRTNRTSSQKPSPKGRSSRKRKSGDSSEDDDEEDEEESDSENSESPSPPARKRGRKPPTGKAATKRTYGRKSFAKASPSTSKGGRGLLHHRPSTALVASGGESTLKPIQRRVVNLACSFPDKSGYLKLFAFRGDLEEGIRDNLKLCLWRRDGSSLLQKYFRDKSVDANTPQFTSSMVYSCWEDKRSDEYMEVKVRCIEHSKQLRVQVSDVDATEKKAKEEYEKFVEEHGKPGTLAASGSARANGNGNRATSSSRKSKADSHDDDADGDDKTNEEDPTDDEEDGEGVEGVEGDEGEEEDEANAEDEVDEESEDPSQEE